MAGDFRGRKLSLKTTLLSIVTNVVFTDICNITLSLVFIVVVIVIPVLV